MPRSFHRRIVALGVARAFLPTDLTGLQLWLDANDASTLFQDAAKTTVAGDGDVVGAWADKSGQGNDATQTTTAAKPLLDTDVLGTGFSGIKFDAADDFLSFPKFGLTAITIYAVVTGIDNETFPRLLDMQNDGVDPYRLIINYVYTENVYRVTLRPNASTPNGSNPVGKHIIAWEAVSGGNTSIYFDSIDTIDIGPTAIPSAWNNDTIASSRIGITISDTNPFNAYVQSLLVYNSVHNVTQRGNVMTYLSNNYGKALS